MAISPTFFNPKKIHWWGDDLGASIQKAFLLWCKWRLNIPRGKNRSHKIDHGF